MNGTFESRYRGREITELPQFHWEPQLRHCERSEAISLHCSCVRGGDCFVALRAPRNDADGFPASLRAKRSNLSSLAHASVAEIASSRFALLAMTRRVFTDATRPRITDA